jgi:phosphomannomutase
MTLITSISGIRGTIGGRVGDSLTPDDVVGYSSAFGSWIMRKGLPGKIIIGRDARITGEMISHLIRSTLLAMGIDVIDLGLAPTPTVELAVVNENAGGGIIITASHNPKNWNALKLLNENGEFLTDKQGKEIIKILKRKDFEYAIVEKQGKYLKKPRYISYHIEKTLHLPLVDVEAIKNANFRIVVDAINSVGGISVPQLLKALGVAEIIELYCSPTGKFVHNPEPLPENLSALASEVKSRKADLGIAVDPDVDRLCFVCENGEFFGEEYTLVAVADYILQNTPGNTVSNFSSTKALQDLTEKYGQKYEACAVGEVNVVAKMKEIQAVIGGEGNGGVIYPQLHYGRDALVGIALFLSHLAKYGKSISSLRTKYPNYYISKNKISLEEDIDIDEILEKIKFKYKKFPIQDTDGLKIEFDSGWVHLRKSNTESIIRIYSESKTQTTAENLAKKIMNDIRELL